MVELPKIDKAKEGLGKAIDGIDKFARSTSAQLADQASSLKETAAGKVEKLTAKKMDPYEVAIVDYNGAFTTMNDNGLSLFRQRERSTDLIEFVEQLINSIANTPKEFENSFEDIKVAKAPFLEVEEYALRDLEAARKSAASAGAGFVAGAAVASMAPTAAMWVATTFGVASTGTAISTLSGAAATNAALAWLGGGALVAGGGGTAAGGALLALAGPIGWTVAGATLLASIALFTKKKFDNRDAKQSELTAVKRNIAHVKELDAKIGDLLQRTASLRELVRSKYGESLEFHGADFLSLSASQQAQLAGLVNNTLACATLLSEHIEQETDHE